MTIHKFLIPAAAVLMLLPVFSFAEEKKENLLDKIEASGQFAPMFPFQPTHDAPANITNVKNWEGTRQGEAGAQGFIAADGDHFIDEQGNERRFLGTNICFTGCFPEKKDAEKVAAELARYGINLVRLHYVHHKFPPGREYPEKDSFLEPEQLDRFDYLFAQLKKNGIYTYFQLNIARKFGAQNGFENAERLPWYNNGIDNVDYQMISLQKKYHSDILNHKNPYTGLKYNEEPAISMLELSNENSIVHAWFGARYNFPSLTEPYASRMKAMWNDFLVEKYENTKNLKDAWVSGLKGDGTEFMPEGKMKKASDSKWMVQGDKLSKYTLDFKNATSKDKLKSSCYASLTVEKIGTNKNMPQFFRKGLKFKAMAPYCLKFKMRSEKAATVGLRFSETDSPWRVAGFQTNIQCGPKWKDYTFNFTSSLDGDNIRLVFSNFTPGTYEIADVSLVSGMDLKWDSDRTLEEKNIDWPYKRNWSEIPQRAFDFTEFLGSLELAYFEDLYSNIKSTVKPKQPVAGTQLHYGFYLPQAEMDYIDYHNYWNHPVFRGKSFSYTNWNLGTNALVNGDGFSGSSLATIARSRILGKPFTISEYDHPSLNFYSAEGNIMVSAMGAFQNWSGIMQFAWSHNTDFFRDVLSQSFDMCSATHKLVHFPACYAMFVRGDVSKGDTETMFTTMSETKKDVELIAKVQSPFALTRLNSHLLQTMPLSVRSGKQLKEMPELFSEEGKTIIRQDGDVPESLKKASASKEMKSSTGELTWNWQKPSGGFFMVDSPLTKVFTGFVRERTFKFDGMTLLPGKTRLDWLTLSLTCTNPKGKGEKGRLAPGNYLLAATGLIHNSKAVIIDLGANKTTTGIENGGNPGVAPILCEGIPATLRLDGLAGKVECYALDPSGARTSKVSVKDDGNGNAEVLIGPEHKTVWYELIVSL